MCSISDWLETSMHSVHREIRRIHRLQSYVAMKASLIVGVCTAISIGIGDSLLYANETESNIKVSATTSPNISSIHDLEQIRSPFERSLALHLLLANANERKLIELFETTSDISPQKRQQVQSLILQRLAQFNPGDAYDQVRSLSGGSSVRLIESIFAEWSVLNLEEAVSFAESLEDDNRFLAMTGILGERNDLPQAKALQIARRLGNERYAVNLIMQEKLRGPIDDPEELWNELVGEIQDNFGQFWMLATVAKAWVDKKGLEVLDEVSQSITNPQTRQHVMESVLQMAAESDPKATFEYALKLNPRRTEVTSLMSAIVATWVKSDPRSALDSASQVERTGLRKRLEDSVVRAWGAQDPRAVLLALESLPTHLHVSAASAAISRLVREDPQEAGSLVANMEGPTKFSAASALVGYWSHQRDFRGALDWVLKEPRVAEFKPMLLTEILASLVPYDPQLAMDEALLQPLEDDKPGLEASVISYLTYSDIDTAREFLTRVRAGTTQIASFAHVGRYYIENGETEQAIALAGQLTSSKREAYFERLLRTWAQRDPTGLLDSIDQLPTAEVKSKAAFALTALNRWSKSLSDEQDERAREFLLENDAEKLKNGEYSSIQSW